MAGHRTGTFIVTKEHRRFVEFASAVQKHRYIGICFGPAGVGKTMSARRFARWDKAEPLLLTWGPRDPSDAIAYDALAKARTAFYTPTVGGPVREVRDDLRRLIIRIEVCTDLALQPGRVGLEPEYKDGIELLVIDEAERLSTQSLEHIRDIFDRTGIGVILIGMPGLERKLERYPQLYNRIGFAHHYWPVKGDELTFVLNRHWRKLGLQLDDADVTDYQAVASIARITGGNFRLLHRLFVQIERILKINELSLVTDDVVEAAAAGRWDRMRKLVRGMCVDWACRPEGPVGPCVSTPRRFTTSPGAPTARQGIAYRCPERGHRPRSARDGQDAADPDDRRHPFAVLSGGRSAVQLPGEDVVRPLERACQAGGYPSTIRVDSGSAFISRNLWAYANDVVLDVSRPGKPTDNGFIEAFNSKLRSECLTATGS